MDDEDLEYATELADGDAAAARELLEVLRHLHSSSSSEACRRYGLQWVMDLVNYAGDASTARRILAEIDELHAQGRLSLHSVERFRYLDGDLKALCNDLPEGHAVRRELFTHFLRRRYGNVRADGAWPHRPEPDTDPDTQHPPAEELGYA